MSDSKFVLTSPEGQNTDLPLVEGTLGPKAVDVRGLYGATGTFTSAAIAVLNAVLRGWLNST